jgi:hypothetical protein
VAEEKMHEPRLTALRTSMEIGSIRRRYLL